MAMEGNGTDTRFENSATPLTIQPLSMACWFNTDSNTANQLLVSIYDIASGTIAWKLEASGAVAGDPVRAISKQAGSEAAAVSTAGFSTGIWHHACGTWVSNLNRNAYLDGGNVGQNNTLRSVSGVDAVGGIFDLDGRMAEVGIWKVALTAAEVAVLGLGYSPLCVRPQSLVFYAPLIRDPDVAQDYRGLLCSYTGVSAPTVAVHPRIIRPSRGTKTYPAPPAPSGRIVSLGGFYKTDTRVVLVG